MPDEAEGPPPPGTAARRYELLASVFAGPHAVTPPIWPAFDDLHDRLPQDGFSPAKALARTPAHGRPVQHLCAESRNRPSPAATHHRAGPTPVAPAGAWLAPTPRESALCSGRRVTRGSATPEYHMHADTLLLPDARYKGHGCQPAD